MAAARKVYAPLTLTVNGIPIWGVALPVADKLLGAKVPFATGRCQTGWPVVLLLMDAAGLRTGKLKTPDRMRAGVL